MLIIIVGCEVGVGIAVGVYKGKVTEVLTGELRGFLKSYDYVNTTIDQDGKIKLTNSSSTHSDNVLKTSTMNALQAWVRSCIGQNVPGAATRFVIELH